MYSSHLYRYGVLYFCGLLLLVNLSWQRASSFFIRLPSSGTSSGSNRLRYSSLKLIPHFNNQKQLKSTCHRSSLLISTESSLSSSVSSPVTAEDLQEIQDIFSKFCDEDHLIDRKTIELMQPFVDLLRDGDLLPREFNDIWEASPKFLNDSSRVDEVSFIQIYRGVDDLFEDDDEEEDEEKRDDGNSDVSLLETQDSGDSSKEVNGNNNVNENELNSELSKFFKSICNDRGLISKDVLQQWEEVSTMLEEGLLGEDEFDELFEKTAKNEMLDASGFFDFNVALDDLFVFEDDDDETEESQESSGTKTSPRSMIIEDDLPPGVLFSQLSDENYLVGMDELNLWTELKELLEDGELLPTELQAIYDKFVLPGSSGKLTEGGFIKLYDEIDNLFEVEDNDEDKVVVVAKESQTGKLRVKEDLLSFLEIIREGDDEPCGFGVNQSDQDQILNIVNVLAQQPTNMIIQKDGNIELFDLAGNWELAYTSSSAMKFNKGLSGIGGSIPNGSFAGVKQELKATKFISDMVYKERIQVIPSSASFDVTVNGSWDIRTSVSLFTGQPSIILYVEPDRVTYGPTSTRGDHWKSLGPLNRLDLSYLDDNLRVMRGCTSSDTIFIFRKIS
mmetsp:Transcript_21163/g.21567  ORF Transcript_21163/g.21567 Transcript_21163/m.21567 type:complete len:617 (+) Transcript_21163:142-1992(+)